jgi:putative PIN family toxin of toxin-antitoxin system
VRVFPDTNVLVSALATRGLCADLFQTILAGHDLVLGETVLLELERTLARKLHIERKPIAELIAFLRQQGEVVAATGSVRLKVRDPKDRAVVAEAVAARADALVTGDRDLLGLAAEAPLPIRSPRELWEMLRTATR